jgi:hypothetical protein
MLRDSFLVLKLPVHNGPGFLTANAIGNQAVFGLVSPEERCSLWPENPVLRRSDHALKHEYMVAADHRVGEF